VFHLTCQNQPVDAIRFFAENHPEQLTQPVENPFFGTIGTMHIANCGKKGNAEALNYLLNWTGPNGERIVDRLGAKQEGTPNYGYIGLGNFTNVETVKACLDNGADPNEPTHMNGLGSTLCKLGRYLVKNKMTESFLFLALAGMEGQRPLHAAAANNNVAVVEVLLQRGADPRIKNKMGETPLDIAEKRGQVRICELLREAMANLDPLIEEPEPPAWWQCSAPPPQEVLEVATAYASDEFKMTKRSSKNSTASTEAGSDSGDDPLASALYVSA